MHQENIQPCISSATNVFSYNFPRSSSRELELGPARILILLNIDAISSVYLKL